MAIHVRKKREKEETTPEWLADILAGFTGSWLFIVLHVLWIIVWFVIRFDISLLTLILSIEAILLVTILLMASNRQAERDDMRDEADYQTDLHSKKEILEVKIFLKKSSTC